MAFLLKVNWTIKQGIQERFKTAPMKLGPKHFCSTQMPTGLRRMRINDDNPATIARPSKENPADRAGFVSFRPSEGSHQCEVSSVPVATNSLGMNGQLPHNQSKCCA